MYKLSGSFFKSLILFYFLSVSALYIIFHYVIAVPLYFFWITNFVLIVGSVSAAWFTLHALHEKGKPFVQLVMLTTVLRLSLYALYCFALIYLSKFPVTNDIVYFAILYLLVTVFDIISVFKKQKETAN